MGGLTSCVINKGVIGQRQAAELGMGTIQKSFGRLKSPLPLNIRKRCLTIPENQICGF
ncbi:hypothetical protein HDV02_000060 [Globomyces sp. JEL0801]|nr:hypothetical protein HDV02_000060 [Globomyces sp. JEL0801]